MNVGEKLKTYSTNIPKNNFVYLFIMIIRSGLNNNNVTISKFVFIT